MSSALVFQTTRPRTFSLSLVPRFKSGLLRKAEHRVFCSTKSAQLRLLSATKAMHQSLDISGIYPPIATPFNEDESISFEKLASNMEKWNKISFKGYVVQGSNGEWCFQNWNERIQVVKEARRLAAPGKLIIAGTGCESTRETIGMTKEMAEAGAHAALVVNPFYYKNNMHADALISHFTKVADQSPIPVLLYNVPGNTGMDIPPEVIVKLAQHPNIIGLKDSGGDISRIASLVFATSSLDFKILAGSAGFLLAAYNVGCVGGICALANVLGEDMCKLASLVEPKDSKAAMDLQLRLVGPNACVTRRFGVPGLKTAMGWLGYYGGPTRSPLSPMNSTDAKTMKQVFEKSGYL